MGFKHKTFRYYFQKLDSTEKEIYLSIYRGVRGFEKEIDIVLDKNVVSHNRLFEIFRCVYNDSPLLYYIDPTRYQLLETFNGYRIIINYVYSRHRVVKLNKYIYDGLVRFRKQHIREGMSDFEMEVAIHDYIISTVEYSKQESNPSKNVIQSSIYTIIGPLFKKQAVCWGIACSFKLLCDYLGLPSLIVLGHKIDNNQLAENHAWNMIKLNRRFYHIDVTWDLKSDESDCVRYDYVNLDDSLQSLDHSWDKTAYPPCLDIENNYFYRKKLFVEDKHHLERIVKDNIQSNTRKFCFRYSSCVYRQQTLLKILEMYILKYRPELQTFSCAINEKFNVVTIEI